MGIRIELSIEQMERAEKLLYGIPNGVETAESNAFNRGLTAGKTEASKQIRQRYAISSGNIKQRVELRRSSGGGDAAIEFSGPKIPLYKFKPSPATRTYVGQKIPVPISGDGDDAVWRMVFKNAKVSGMDAKASGFKSGKNWFIANFSSGHTGIFKRTGGVTNGGTGKAAIEEVWGFSVADMLDYEPAKEAVGKRIQEVVGQRLEHEIGRLLSRY